MTAQSHPPVAIGLAVDRSAEERTLDGLIDAAVADKDTVVLALARDAAPLAARDARWVQQQVRAQSRHPITI